MLKFTIAKLTTDLQHVLHLCSCAFYLLAQVSSVVWEQIIFGNKQHLH